MQPLQGTDYHDFHPKKGITIRPVVWNRSSQKLIDWILGWDEKYHTIKKELTIDLVSPEKEMPF